jgi:hypothetical protein
MGAAPPTDQDEERWRQVRSWLMSDAAGQQILAALNEDPQAGAIALKRRMRASPAPGVTNQVTDSEIQKFVSLAHADRVYVEGDEYNLDLDLNPIHRARGFPRFLMVLGMLTSLTGFAILLYGGYLFYVSTSTLSDLSTLQPGEMPPTPGFPPELFVGFAVFFGGMVLTAIGSIFRPKDRTPSRAISGRYR